MENKFRNEMEIKLGEHTILLRPTFENIAAMESHVGSVAWLTWKYSRGVSQGGKTNLENAVKAIPPLTECAQIIYYNQAATKADDSTLKKYSLEEIWTMVLEEGAAVSKDILGFLGQIASGGKNKDQPDNATEGEKKS